MKQPTVRQRTEDTEPPIVGHLPYKFNMPTLFGSTQAGRVGLRMLDTVAKVEMEEICPSCGDWTDALDGATGWCAKCSPVSTIKSESWLARHADEIETWIVAGNSLSKAKRLVATFNVPLCHCCGNLIKGGKDNHLFCTTTALCRSSQRRYRTLRERYARQNSRASYEDSRAAAIQQIVREKEANNASNSRRASTNGKVRAD